MIIHASPKHRVMVAPATGQLATMFPKAPQLSWEGVQCLAIPHLLPETLLLRSMGFEAPAPILTQYQWTGMLKPFEAQRQTCAMMTTNTAAYVLNGMGTGKTKCALWSFDFLRLQGLAKRMLVVAPLSTLDATWRGEVFRTTSHLSAVVLHGSAKKRLKLLAEDHDIYLINPGGLGVIAEALKKRTDINVVTIDELTAFKNATADRSKLMKEIAERMQWRWGMTGSPTPQAPTDAWGQCRVITPNTVPKFFSRFREQVMVKVNEFRWVPKRDAAEIVFSVMQPAVRFTLDDVAEIPDGAVRVIEVPMGKRQAEVYKTMKDHAHAAIEAGEVTAANAGGVLSKLLQISMGYVYNSKGETVVLDNEARLDLLMSLVSDTDQKVIVFSPFKHALHGIFERIKREGFDVAEVSGDTPASSRGAIFSTFQNEPNIKVLAAHPACMAHGLTLTAASTIVWFGPIADLEIFEQANARIRRVGQKHKQQVFLMQATPAEKRMYTLLESKQVMQTNLLDLFEADT